MAVFRIVTVAEGEEKPMEWMIVGEIVPQWVFDEGYAPTGEVRIPRVGELFWSPVKQQLVYSVTDDSVGPGVPVPRVIFEPGSKVKSVPDSGAERHGLRAVEKE